MDCRKEFCVLIGWLLRRSSGNKKSLTQTLPFVPCLTVLEDRTVPSTFTVMNLADHGSGSLRDAIVAANQTPGADVIQFQAGLGGVITLTGGSLNITDSLTISGPGGPHLPIDCDSRR